MGLRIQGCGWVVVVGEYELLVDILASVDITVSTVPSILKAQAPSQKDSI
tara:strand:- start:140 stop:289 length:150 start_codon:yes stop_codon:yes gene_type:complete